MEKCKSDFQLVEELFARLWKSVDEFRSENQIGAAAVIGTLDMLKMRLFILNEAAITNERALVEEAQKLKDQSTCQ